jgi:hypothetical protein
VRPWHVAQAMARRRLRPLGLANASVKSTASASSLLQPSAEGAGRLVTRFGSQIDPEAKQKRLTEYRVACGLGQIPICAGADTYRAGTRYPGQEWAAIAAIWRRGTLAARPRRLRQGR